MSFYPILQYPQKLYVGWLGQRKDRRQEENYARLDKIEIRRGGTHKEAFTVKCTFMYDIYGTVR